ncbi:Phosphoglycolate phosphatase [compost metagenome]
MTSNTRKNVAPALGDAIRYFDPQCLFYFDRSLEQKDKAWCLVEGARLLGVAPSRCLYVGDQPADADAARAAGWQFLGVSYGWGLQLGDTSVRVVESVPAVANLLLAEAPSPLKGYRPAKVKV